MASTPAAQGGRLPTKYLADLAGTITTLRGAWEAYQCTGEHPREIRSVIAASWERSAERRVSPERRAAELDGSSLRGFQPLDGVQRALRQASAPVVAELERELSSTNSAVVICDEFGAILDRAGDRTILRRTERQNFVPGALWNEPSAGTNGIGLALTLGRPAQVLGGEHFCVGFQEYACSAAPVRHPVTRAVVGLLDVTSDAREASPLAYALVAQAAGAIERRMEEHVFGRERALLERYLRGRVARSSPLLTVDRAGRTVIQNAPAAEQLSVEDVTTVLALARDALRQGRDVDEQLALSAGATRVDVHIAREEGEVIGAVIAISAPRRPRVLPASEPVKGWEPLVGASPAMSELFRQAARAAASAGLLLIEGEAGTGKLTLARAIHERGRAAARPCHVVTASRRGWQRAWRSAITEHAGTIVLRRLDVLSPAEQIALADELDELAATPQPPRIIGLVTTAEFGIRQELRDRLSTGQLHIPPLRLRGVDLHLLIAAWSRRRAERSLSPVDVTDAAKSTLAQHPWPGNVRELFATLDAAALRHPGIIRPQDFQLPPPSGVTSCSLRDIEHASIRSALERSGGNITHAAELLGISRTTLHRRLRSYRTLGPKPS